ncbi:gaba permease protein [Rutstroemia sp. NJR-2017a BBW]|nr:gaba permease protein [Rutstroemia sp. NJR-2017a BBW]
MNEDAGKVFSHDVAEDNALETMGYRPELKRSFGLLGMIGFSFSIVTSWSALGGVLVTGVNAGGPPVMIWGWVGISCVSLCVVYSMAEMCSEYPVAGGQYSWVYILSPKSIRRQFSYLTGWFMIIGQPRQPNLRNPAVAYRPCRLRNNPAGHVYQPLGIKDLRQSLQGSTDIQYRLIYCDHCNHPCMQHQQTLSSRISRTLLASVPRWLGSLAYYSRLSACVVVSITVLEPPSTNGLTFASDDAPSHMTEELKDASKEAPRAMVLSVYIGAITGFIFLIAVCFCVGDIDEVANTATLVPLIQIYFDSTNSNVGACFLASMIVIINVGSANALLAEGSRSLYAFARDRGLPFSSQISKVSSKHKVPVVAILLGAIVQMAFNSIYFGTVTGFNTVIAIATEGFYLSYAMPLLVRLISYFNGSHRQLTGPWAMKPLVSLLVNGVGLAYLLFACITFNFPSVSPVTSENMNYTSAAIGVIMFVAAVTWFTTARKHFSGPEIEVVVHGLAEPSAGAGVGERVESSNSDETRAEKKQG